MKIHTYVKAGRALMDAFGVRHVFLVTDSQGAVDEAMACAREHPDICRDLTFRFLDKKRWVGAEGGMWGLVEAGCLSKLITHRVGEPVSLGELASGVSGHSDGVRDGSEVLDGDRRRVELRPEDLGAHVLRVSAESAGSHAASVRMSPAR